MPRMIRRRSTLLIGLALVVATVAVFHPVLRHEFVGWDDPETIYENPLLRPPTWHGVAHYWTHGDPGLYAPLTYLFWSALAHVAQVQAPNGGTELNPAIFHAANLALHVTTTLAVFATLRELLWWRRRGQPDVQENLPAAAGALLFALHPLQVESVAWATAAKDLSCGLFSVLTLLLYLRWLRNHGAPSPSPGTPGEAGGEGTPRSLQHVAVDEGPQLTLSRNTRRGKSRAVVLIIAAFACLLLALLCKSAAVVVPLLLVVLDRLVVRRPWHAIARAVAPFFVAVLPFVVIAKHFQTADALPPSPLAWRPVVAADAIGFYVQKLVVPTSLTIDYGRTPAAVIDGRAYALTLVSTAALALAAILCAWRGARMFLGGILVFVLAPLPVLGLVPFMFQIHSTVADHYVYLAMLGPAIVLCALLARWPRAPAYALVAVVLVALGVVSYRQTRVWRDSVALFSHAAEITPASATVHANLANALDERRDADGALREYEAAVALDGRNHKARLGLARAYFLRERYEEAIAQAKASLDSTLPGESRAREYLIIGMSELRRGQYDAAIDALQRSLSYEPQNRAIFEQLMLARRMKAQGGERDSGSPTTAPGTAPIQHP
jgi:hypothetical protein